MVVPIAAAAARLAPRIASAGGRMMHSSNAGVRKMGSKMLSYGGGKNKDFSKMEGLLSNVVKKADLTLKTIGKISKGVAKIIGVLAKHSPALKQQLVVLNKGLSVMLRPIGDIMAKFLRPMAVWVMKVAQKWYSLFGTGSKEKESKAYKEDQLKQAQTELESAKISGNPADIAMAQANVDKIKASMKPKDTSSPLGKIWNQLIPEGFKETLQSLGKVFQELWAVIKEVGLILWDVFGPALKVVAGIIGLVLVGALKVVTFLFEGIAFVLKMLAEGLKVVRVLIEVAIYWLGELNKWLGEKIVQAFKWVIDKAKEVWSFLKDSFITSWQTLKDTLSNLWTWVKDTFIGVWDSVHTAMKNMWTKVKDIIDKIQFWKKPDSDTEEKAVGGFIPTTGIYKLHAGERVLTAGDTARSIQNSNSNSVSFNNIFNISATLNSEMDIEDLAKKLADLNETELRRRVSYM